ncbi:ADP-ribosylglycohydrolase family protein [Pelomyxa schiedti]|nr:ADP-ribosylglycohydrolase family protein [Pelomyxa schiedti]
MSERESSTTTEQPPTTEPESNVSSPPHVLPPSAEVHSDESTTTNNTNADASSGNNNNMSVPSQSCIELRPSVPTVPGTECDIVCVTCETVASLMREEPNKLVIVDCRFPYEFEGGHIENAVNLHTREQILEYFFDNNNKRVPSDVVVVFHCEFSSKRGPDGFRYLRKMDRVLNLENYPTLFYPEAYVLQGGYRQFFSTHKDLCEPKQYVTMRDDRFSDQMNQGIQQSKSSKLRRVSSSPPIFKYRDIDRRLSLAAREFVGLKDWNIAELSFVNDLEPQAMQQATGVALEGRVLVFRFCHETTIPPPSCSCGKRWTWCLNYSSEPYRVAPHDISLRCSCENELTSFCGDVELFAQTHTELNDLLHHASKVFVQKYRSSELVSLGAARVRRAVCEQDEAISHPRNPESLFDAALGSLLGGLVGEALGGPLEGLHRRIEPEMIEHAFGMPGGGIHWLAPGQITDDGELTLCLIHALIQSLSAYDVEEVAKSYLGWIKSAPFDIGGTCRKTLGYPATHNGALNVAKLGGVGKAMHAAASLIASPLSGNGAMMRILPLAVWGHKLPPDDLGKCAELDAGLSHAYPSCCVANACYAIAVATLISHWENPCRQKLAFQAAREYAAKRDETVLKWMEQCGTCPEGGTFEHFPVNGEQGSVETSFRIAMCLLGEGRPHYLHNIKRVLLVGGDTDTNAMISGGVLGSCEGVGGIPQAWVQSVLQSDTTLIGVPRPQHLHPKNISKLVEHLLVIAPTTLILRNQW